VPYAASLSVHAEAAVAVGETVGHLLDRVGPGPDLAVLFVTASHLDRFDDIVGSVVATLGPQSLIAATAVSVLAGSREAEELPAVSLWGGGTGGDVETVRLSAAPDGSGGVHFDGLEALDPGPGQAAHTLILLADPFTFPIDHAIDAIAEIAPDLTVVGGLASAARAPGGNRLAVTSGAQVSSHADGAVGLLLFGGATVSTIVSQGCRPIGKPQVITRAEGHQMLELAGRPSMERLNETFQALNEADKLLVNQGVHIGRVVDEHKLDFVRGDFIIRAVMGADRDSGAIAIGEPAQVGSTVQFQVRDALTADEDLYELLGRLDRPADGALVFTCNGRGSQLFEEPDHDAIAVSASTRDQAVAGMFCAGEIGPVGGRVFVHGFTASVALFHDN
jgi:small ligand-binding sensory domain FIST